jgi:hypothetical protein
MASPEAVRAEDISRSYSARTAMDGVTMRVSLFVPWSAATFVIGFRAQRGVDGEYEVHQLRESVPDPGIGQLVPCSAALGDGDNESASAQTGEVIGEDLAGYPDLVGKVRRIARSLPQAEQHLGSRRIRECVSEPGESVTMQQSVHAVIVQIFLDTEKGECSCGSVGLSRVTPGGPGWSDIHRPISVSVRQDKEFTP